MHCFLQDLIPFAIVGSERNVVIDGKAVRGRKTRWGVINGKCKILSPLIRKNSPRSPLAQCTVEDEKHCEFVHLRNFLTRTHLQDLIETTAQIHYEAFRAKQLLAIKESTQQQPASTPISSPAATATPMGSPPSAAPMGGVPGTPATAGTPTTATPARTSSNPSS